MTMTLQCVAENSQACKVSCQSKRTGGGECAPVDLHHARPAVENDDLMVYLYERLLSNRRETPKERLMAALEVFAPDVLVEHRKAVEVSPIQYAEQIRDCMERAWDEGRTAYLQSPPTNPYRSEPSRARDAWGRTPHDSSCRRRCCQATDGCHMGCAP